MSKSGWEFAVINLASSAIPLVPGVTGKKIRVLAALVDANNGDSTWYFQSSTGSVRLTGNLFVSSGPAGSSSATGQFVLPHAPTGWFETAAGDDLELILAGGSAGIGGCLVYELAD